MTTRIVQLTDNALAEIREGLALARRTARPERRPEEVGDRAEELLPIINASDVEGPDGGMCEFGGLYDDGYRVLAYRPRRGGLSAVGLFAGTVPAGGEGYAWHLSGSIVRSTVLAAAGANPRDRIGAAADSFIGAVNPLGRFYVRGYDGDAIILEITEPPVDRKLVRLPTGQIVSVREIESGQEYTVSISDGIVTWGLA